MPSKADVYKQFPIKIVNSMYGKLRIIEGYRGLSRTYVKTQGKGRRKSYYLSTSFYPSTDAMVDVNGEYHFPTLNALREALNTW
jgi:hypothetical protein